MENTKVFKETIEENGQLFNVFDVLSHKGKAYVKVEDEYVEEDVYEKQENVREPLGRDVYVNEATKVHSELLLAGEELKEADARLEKIQEERDVKVERYNNLFDKYEDFKFLTEEEKLDVPELDDDEDEELVEEE